MFPRIVVPPISHPKMTWSFLVGKPQWVCWGVLPTILGKSQIFTIYNHLKNCRLPFASVVNRSDGLVLGRWRIPPWELGIHEVFSHFSKLQGLELPGDSIRDTFLGWWKRDPQKSLSDLQLDQLGDQKVTAWIT